MQSVAIVNKLAADLGEVDIQDDAIEDCQAKDLQKREPFKVYVS